MRTQEIRIAGLIVSSSILLCSCAVAEYRFQGYPIGTDASMSFEQAEQVCVPRAELAGQQARGSAASRRADISDDNMTTSCRTTNVYGDVYDTKCESKPTAAGASGVGAFVEGMAHEMALQDAYANSYNAVLKSCMAESGWRLEQVCVANCN